MVLNKLRLKGAGALCRGAWILRWGGPEYQRRLWGVPEGLGFRV